MKKNSLSDLFSITNQSLAYGIGILGRQVLVYLSLPLFTNYLSPEAYGAVSVLMAFMSFIDVISNAGLPAATFRLYNDTDDPAAQKFVIGSAFVLFGGYALVIALIAISFAQNISALLFAGSGDKAHIIILVAVLMVALTMVNFGYLVLRIRVRPVALSVHAITQTIFQIGCSLFLVISYRLGDWGYWIGQLIGVSLGLIVMLWLLRSDLHFRISRQHLVNLSIFALPLVPATLAQWALRLVDRMMLSSMIGLEQVAIYEIAFKIATLSGFLMIPFASAWPQFAYSVAKKPNAKQVYKDILTYVTIGSIIPALGIYAFSPELLSILAPSTYNSAIKVIPWLILAQVAWAVYPILVIGLYLKKKTSLIAILMLLAALANILLMLWLIPLMGSVGAGIASFIAYALLAVVSYYYSQKEYSYSLDTTQLLITCTTAGIAALVITTLNFINIPGWLHLLARVSCLVICLLILLAYNYIKIRDLYLTLLKKSN